MGRQTTFEDYEGFVEKFKPKKTTDDCYTPPKVYDAVLEYVKTIYPLDGKKIVRPFYPNGDYERDMENYGDDVVVVDNPPFSIITKIRKTYQAAGVKFFLFAPALTAFDILRKDTKGVSIIVAEANITYTNGANVRSAFITNLLADPAIVSAPELTRSIEKAQQKTEQLQKFVYPPEVLTISRVQGLCRLGFDLRIPLRGCLKIHELESQKKAGKGCFGGAFLMSSANTKLLTDIEETQAEEARRKAEEARRKAEEARRIYWELSEQERETIKYLDNL